MYSIAIGFLFFLFFFLIFPPKGCFRPATPGAALLPRGFGAAPARLRCPRNKHRRDKGTGHFSFQFHCGNGRILTGTSRGEIGTYCLPEGCANQHAGLDIKVQGK